MSRDPGSPMVKTPFPDQRTNILLATQPRKKDMSSLYLGAPTIIYFLLVQQKYKVTAITTAIQYCIQNPNLCKYDKNRKFLS